MKNILKQGLLLGLIALGCVACGPSAFQNPFPENAEDYGMQVISFPQFGEADQLILLVDFTYTLDPQAALLDKLVRDGREVPLRAADGSLDQDKLVEFTPYELANNNWDVFSENEPVRCYIYDAALSKVRCMISMKTLPDPDTSLTFGIAAVASVKLTEAIEVEGQNIPAGTALPFHIATPILDYKNATVFDNAPGEGEEESEGDEAAEAVVGAPSGAAGAASADPQEITIDGKKFSCSGSGSAFKCDEVKSTVKKSSGDSGGCSLQPNTRGRDAVSMICLLIFSLSFVIARRKA